LPPGDAVFPGGEEEGCSTYDRVVNSDSDSERSGNDARSKKLDRDRGRRFLSLRAGEQSKEPLSLRKRSMEEL